MDFTLEYMQQTGVFATNWLILLAETDQQVPSDLASD
jgi:hypothetical protein